MINFPRTVSLNLLNSSSLFVIFPHVSAHSLRVIIVSSYVLLYLVTQRRSVVCDLDFIFFYFVSDCLFPVHVIVIVMYCIPLHLLYSNIPPDINEIFLFFKSNHSIVILYYYISAMITHTPTRPHTHTA